MEQRKKSNPGRGKICSKTLRHEGACWENKVEKWYMSRGQSVQGHVNWVKDFQLLYPKTKEEPLEGKIATKWTWFQKYSSRCSVAKHLQKSKTGQGMRSWMDSLALSLVDIFPTLLHPEHLFILFIKWLQGFGWNIPGHGTSWELGQPFNWTRSTFFLFCFTALSSIVVFSLHLQTLVLFYPLLHSLLCTASLSPRPTLTCSALSNVNPSIWITKSSVFGNHVVAFKSAMAGSLVLCF